VCLSECCICFTHMLQVFYLDVVYVLQWFSSIFPYVFMHVSSVLSVFFCMLQALIVDVSKIDWMFIYGMRVGIERGVSSPARTRAAGPCGARNTGAAGRRPSDAGPRVDA
jgi:hypothetical protein